MRHHYETKRHESLQVTNWAKYCLKQAIVIKINTPSMTNCSGETAKKQRALYRQTPTNFTTKPCSGIVDYE